MCYSVYLSTEWVEDLSRYNTELVKFEPVSDLNDSTCTSFLDFPYRWHIASISGCGCTFRHLFSIELGFAEPLDWYEEKIEEIKATKELYFALIDILNSGHGTDLLDVWNGALPTDILIKEVSLDSAHP